MDFQFFNGHPIQFSTVTLDLTILRNIALLGLLYFTKRKKENRECLLVVVELSEAEGKCKLNEMTRDDLRAISWPQRWREAPFRVLWIIYRGRGTSGSRVYNIVSTENQPVQNASAQAAEHSASALYFIYRIFVFSARACFFLALVPLNYF